MIKEFLEVIFHLHVIVLKADAFVMQILRFESGGTAEVLDIKNMGMQRLRLSGEMWPQRKALNRHQNHHNRFGADFMRHFSSLSLNR